MQQIWTAWPIGARCIIDARIPIFLFSLDFSISLYPFSQLSPSPHLYISVPISISLCSAQTQTGIGLLGKTPTVKQFPPSKAYRRTRILYDPFRKRRYEANKCDWRPAYCSGSAESPSADFLLHWLKSSRSDPRR